MPTVAIRMAARCPIALKNSQITDHLNLGFRAPNLTRVGYRHDDAGDGHTRPDRPRGGTPPDIHFFGRDSREKSNFPTQIRLEPFRTVLPPDERANRRLGRRSKYRKLIDGSKHDLLGGASPGERSSTIRPCRETRMRSDRLKSAHEQALWRIISRKARRICERSSTPASLSMTASSTPENAIAVR